jgi:hypothetical protein
MADTAITGLTDGAPAQGTDVAVVARGATNRKIALSAIRSYMQANLHPVATSGSYADLSGTPDLTALPAKETVAGMTYTLVSGDKGKIKVFTNAGAVTVTLPNNLAEDFWCVIVQQGAGQVTLSPASGATLRHVDGHTKTKAQYAQVTLTVWGNSGGTAAEYYLKGETDA